jgi:hypothetical protein
LLPVDNIAIAIINNSVKNNFFMLIKFLKPQRDATPDGRRCRRNVCSMALVGNVVDVMVDKIHPVDFSFFNPGRSGAECCF